MGFLELILIGIALAMDAVGLTISLGINPFVDRESKIKFIISFGFFQFLFIFLGGFFGVFFDTYVASIPNIIGGITVGLIGIIMIIDGYKNKDNEESILIKKCMYIVLGISVSIDALVIGFTIFNHIGKMILLFLESLIIGLITLLLCTLGFFLCRYVKKMKFVNKYSDYLGGVILIIFSLKMMFF